MLNTTQVKQLVKQRFGNYAKCYVNKCKYNNKRNLAFTLQTDLTDAELKAEAEKLEQQYDAIDSTYQYPLSDEMLKAQFMRQEEIVSVLDKINRELDERARIAAENAALNNNIITTDNSTNVSSNSMNVTDFSVDGTDQVAKQLANVGQGSY